MTIAGTDGDDTIKGTSGGEPDTDVGFVGSGHADTFDVASGFTAWIRPGNGRDRVDAHQRGKHDGVLTASGGPETDHVFVDQALGLRADLRGGRDYIGVRGKRLRSATIRTGGGRDDVDVWSAGFGLDVDLGAGNDVAFAVGDGRGRTINGGPGHDSFQTVYHHYTLHHVERVLRY